MKIKIYNDQKEKSHSFEAYIEPSPGCYLIELGGSEKAAIFNLKEKINHVIIALNNLDYTNVQYVDYDGFPLEE